MGVAVYASDGISQHRSKRFDSSPWGLQWLRMDSPKFLLQTGKFAQSHFSVGGLYWSQVHRTAP